MRSTSRVVILAALLSTLVAAGACKSNKEAAKDQPGSGSVAAGSGTGTGTGTAATPDKPVEKPGDVPVVDLKAPLTHPLFWVAKKDGKEIHLLGTFHMGIDPTRLPAVVWDAFRAAKTLAVEIDILDPSLLQIGTRQDGSTLEQELGPEDWAKLVSVMGETLADSMQPMTAASAGVVLQVKYLPQTQPMDLAFVLEAKKSDKKMVYLEEASLQVAILDKWFDKRMLHGILAEADQLEQKSMELLAAYTSGDEAAIAKLSDDRDGWRKTGRTDAEYDQMNEEMLLGRNRSWIPEIEKLIAEGDAFVAVGAMHLIGDGSVVDLLRKDGYEVERVSP
ncbi:MAG: TraB/GumN family protein [Kofleriaceae bacterium]|nr:TraB/GumN family protein [Myxococcales bacterium]MCB9559962.1 TraB/GumN family protein [Kofleriaceae bacterium]MCB9571578.1 TraB/GumN family protein [Kofleriaceae bacterium]